MSNRSQKPPALTADEIAHYRTIEDDLTTTFAEKLRPLLVSPAATRHELKNQFVREYLTELHPYLAEKSREHTRNHTLPQLRITAGGIVTVILAPTILSVLADGSSDVGWIRYVHEHADGFSTLFTIWAGVLTLIAAVSAAKSLLEDRPNHRANKAWKAVQEAALLGQLERPDQVSVASSTTARAVTVNGVRASLQGLLDEWTDYKNDTTRYYLTHPTLHDTTGTIPPVVAYNQALADLVHAVDGLHNNSPTESVDAAHVLAETAWERWHDAVDHAGEVGLDDRSTEERAALARLARLVHRLQNSPAADPELPSIKARIQTCLDKITTVSVSWSDIAALPGLDHAVRRELPAGVESS